MADIGAPKSVVSASLPFTVNASKFHLGLLRISTSEMDLNNDPGWFCTSIFHCQAVSCQCQVFVSPNHSGTELFRFANKLVLIISLCATDLLLLFHSLKL